MAQEAIATSLPAAAPKDEATQVEAIVVGARASQQSAIARKKRSTTAQDSIVADDVGSFPDSNWTRYIKRKAPGISDPYKNSVDFLHRYPGDVELARKLGVNVFRTSIEWARIEPRRGVRDPKAIAYYDDLIRRIRAAGMRPMITLDHWVYPGWVADQGAWDNPRTRADWLSNARFIVNRYKRQGVIWITFNEASAYMYKELTMRPMNLGQLAMLVRARYLVDAVGYNHVRGLPLKAAELAEAIGNLVAEAEGIEVDLTAHTLPAASGGQS